MTEKTWVVALLDRSHDRQAFDCGVHVLNEYLHRFARQNQSAGISQHFVAVDQPGSSRVLGYYALSAGAVAFENVPEALRKRLPKYPIPVAHIGRLAVDQAVRQRGLGSWLLIDALTRTLRAADQLGIHAIEVLAINDAARAFYQKFGFQTLSDDQRHLYLPLAAVRKLSLI